MTVIRCLFAYWATEAGLDILAPLVVGLSTVYRTRHWRPCVECGGWHIP